MFNEITCPIRHYHYDIFELILEQWDLRLKISFVTNVKGDIDTLIVPFEPTGNDIVFKRASNKAMQERAFLEQFVGIYEFLEAEMTVSLKQEDVLSVSLLGQPDYELEPYKGTEFLVTGHSGIGIEFERDVSGNATGAIIMLADGVFHASKKS